MSNLSISLFGEFTVLGQTHLAVSSSKSKCLIAYLALQPGFAVSRITLAKALWPHVSEEQSRHYLSRDLKPVRNALHEQLAINKETICLKAEDLYVDAVFVDWARKIGTTEFLEQALLILDRGIFLLGCRGEWVEGRRQHYFNAHLSIIKDLIAIYTKDGSHDSTINLLRKRIALLPNHEEPYHDLVSFLLDCGNIVEANTEYQNIVRMLQKNDLPHSPMTKKIALRLQTARKTLPTSSAEVSFMGLAKKRLENAPIQQTAFIGRLDVLTNIIGHLLGDSPARLLTLSGVAGVGKTRLCLEVAESTISSFPDGAWFVDLRSIRDAKFLNSFLLSKVGIEVSEDSPPLQTLISFLKNKKTLLVLDNCEHLASHCKQLVANLLYACAGLQILATSRQVLGLKHEREITVPPLALPALNLPSGSLTDATVEEIAQFESVKFFVARATEVRSDFILTPKNITLVMEICRNLDNLPFAIELLARWAKHHELERLLELSKRPMHFMGDALRWMLYWDESILSNVEKTLLFLTAISYDGLSLQAAEFIIGAVLSDPNIDVAHGYHSLKNRFLIEIEVLPNRGTRATVLEAVRAFALEKLDESSGAAILQKERVRYLSTLVSSQLENIGTPKQATALGVISAEVNNIRAALSWCQTTSQEFDVALRLARDMYDYWHTGGLFTEGYQWLVSLGYHEASQTPGMGKLRAQVVNEAGNFAYLQNNMEGAQMHYEEALRLQTVTDDIEGVAGTLGNLATLADIAGNHTRALELQQESHRLHESLSFPWRAAVNVLNIGGIEFRRKRYVEAQAIWETLLPISDQLGRPELRQLALSNLGSVTFELGNIDGAWKYYCDALVLSQKMNDAPVMIRCFENMAEVLCRKEAWLIAIQLFGAADAWRDRCGFVRQSSEKDNVIDLIGQTKIAVGVSNYQQWYAEGRALSLDSATAIALAWHGDESAGNDLSYNTRIDVGS